MSEPSASEPQLEDLRAWSAALKHDVGKSVAWRSANLPESAWQGELDAPTAAALRADLLATHIHAGREEAVWSVFDRLAAPWPRPWPAELEATAVAVAMLQTLAAAFASGDRTELAAARPRIREAQSTIRAELAALHRRLLRER